MTELSLSEPMATTARQRADRWSSLQVLLGIFAACLVAATLIALALGFDLVVPPPVISESLDLPGRLTALQPFREARWPFDAISTLLYVVGFAALALSADSIASLARSGPVGVLRAAVLASGLLGAIAGLLYLGGTKAAIASYCDCGYLGQEAISQFWAINIVQGATDWLRYGAIAFGALGAALTAVMLADRGLPRAWRWIAASAAAFLIGSIVLSELGVSPANDLAVAVASGLLLPVWALVLAMRSGGERDTTDAA